MSNARVRRAPRSVSGKGAVISVKLEVSAEITGGTITQEQLADWCKTAIADYHRWRVGWVGLAMHCSLKTPEVKICGKEETQG